MRSLLGFFSLLAFGFLAAGVIFVVGSGTSELPFGMGVAEGKAIDLGSLLLGLALGVVLSALARVSWSELPHRAANWLFNHEGTIYRLIWAGLFAAILLYY